MRPLGLLLRSAKLVPKCENGRLSGLGQSWNDAARMDRQIEDGGTSLIHRKDDRVPFVIGVETQSVEEEIADFAVPAIVLNEPERAQTNVVVPLRQRLGLELTDAFVDCFATFVNHPRYIVVRDAKIVRIIWFCADPREKRSALRISP